MKPQHLLAPVLVLLAGVSWLGWQENSLTRLEDEKRLVMKNLGEISSFTSPPNPARPGTDGIAGELTLDDGSPDWEAIARLMVEARESDGSPAGMKMSLKIRERFLTLSEDEIVDGIVKLHSFDFDQKIAEGIEATLLSRLIEINPGRTLDLTGDAITDQQHRFRRIQEKAFLMTAKQNPTAAMAWLDRQVEEGKLQFKSLDRGQSPRLKFERALLGQLIGSDHRNCAFQWHPSRSTARQEIRASLAAFRNLCGSRNRQRVRPPIQRGKFLPRNRRSHARGSTQRSLRLARATRKIAIFFP